MRSLQSARVRHYLEDIASVSADFHKVLLQVRELFFERSPGLHEDVKYGGVVFYLDDEMIAGVFAYSQHVSIEFGRGAELDNPDSILEGKGKFRRHIKIRRFEDIAIKRVPEFIEATIGLATSRE